jgi:cytochrome c553
MSKMLKNVVLVFIAMLCPMLVLGSGDITRGKQLAEPCAACHGVDGNSLAPNFPKLAGLGAKYLAKQMADIQKGVERQVPEMTGLLTNMTPQDLNDLAAYFNSLPTQLSGASKLEVQVNAGKTDALVLGERLYRAGKASTKTPACTGCHSPSGMGNAPAGYPRLSGQYPQYIEKQLKEFRAGLRVNDGEAQIMRKVAENLSDGEIQALANYIAGIH